jgi:hypothetical protein
MYGRVYDTKNHKIVIKFVPVCYVFAKAEYALTTASARDAMFKWASAVYNVKLKFCAGVADGSTTLYAGVVFAREPTDGGRVPFFVGRQLYKNPDNSHIAYATDWPHIARKEGTEKTTGFDDLTRKKIKIEMERLHLCRSEAQHATLGALTVAGWKSHGHKMKNTKVVAWATAFAANKLVYPANMWFVTATQVRFRCPCFPVESWCGSSRSLRARTPANHTMRPWRARHSLTVGRAKSTCFVRVC